MKPQKKVPMRLTSPQNSSIPLPSLLGLITFLSYVFFNAHLPLTDPVETNYALTAKEMYFIMIGYPQLFTEIIGMTSPSSPIG